ncbi:hypothetical protein T310_8927, partial [Rasamsonia emersonii CBS 393.64]
TRFILRVGYHPVRRPHEIHLRHLSLHCRRPVSVDSSQRRLKMLDEPRRRRRPISHDIVSCQPAQHLHWHRFVHIPRRHIDENQLPHLFPSAHQHLGRLESVIAAGGPSPEDIRPLRLASTEFFHPCLNEIIHAKSHVAPGSQEGAVESEDAPSRSNLWELRIRRRRPTPVREEKEVFLRGLGIALKKNGEGDRGRTRRLHRSRRHRSRRQLQTSFNIGHRRSGRENRPGGPRSQAARALLQRW